LAASIAAAGQHTQLILGNVVGSNISNIGMVIGISAILVPLVVQKTTVRKEVPIMIGVSLLLIALSLDNGISQWEGGLLIAGLIVRPLMAISLFLGVVLVGLFFSVVYYGALRHQGLVFIFIVSLYWIVYKETMITPIDKLAKYRVLLLKGSVYVVLSAIFLVHIAGAMRLIYRDLVKELSSSRAFGEFIMASKRFQEAIIIGEPDYRLQSLPYYVKNRIFIPREGIFRNYIAQTRANKSKLTMGELLESGRQLRISEMKPCLLFSGILVWPSKKINLLFEQSNIIKNLVGLLKKWMILALQQLK
ncbi:hypothetical protein LCGC14_2865650, partial [marine sediment metagenome]